MLDLIPTSIQLMLYSNPVYVDLVSRCNAIKHIVDGPIRLGFILNDINEENLNSEIRSQIVVYFRDKDGYLCGFNYKPAFQFEEIKYSLVNLGGIKPIFLSHIHQFYDNRSEIFTCIKDFTTVEVMELPLDTKSREEQMIKDMPERADFIRGTKRTK